MFFHFRDGSDCRFLKRFGPLLLLNGRPSDVDLLVLGFSVEVIDHALARHRVGVPTFPDSRVQFEYRVKSNAADALRVKLVDGDPLCLDLRRNLLLKFIGPLHRVAEKKQELVGKEIA